MISADLGVRTTELLLEDLRRKSSGMDQLSEDLLLSELKGSIREILRSSEAPELEAAKCGAQPRVVAIVGVNGVGKTTTIGKLANQLVSRGARVMVGACDTFRAAAVEQMELWADRCGATVVKGDENSKPSTVAYKTIHEAIDGEADVVLVDTAGRLHTRVNLMNELVGMIQLIGRELPGAPHETLLVVDATTGQNALQQAREFHERLNLSGIVVTKLDGTPKGGIVVAIKNELGIPVRYIGVGEGIEDLRPFSADEFVEGLFAESREAAPESVSARGEVRRRRREQAEDA